jgi:hypothetical protein
MRVGGIYSFNGGREAIEAGFASEYQEVLQAIAAVDANQLEKKSSLERGMVGRELFSPVRMNNAFKAEFAQRNWRNLKVMCDYPVHYYTPEYEPRQRFVGAFRDMDFMKNKVGVEVQLGKYAFMVYNVCAKMTIFHNLGHIDVGIEVVPLKELALQMSSGVSYFEQFVWDLEQRGVSNIDIPVLILGIVP